MIDQKTVVQVNYGQEKTLFWERLLSSAITSRLGGHIEVTASGILSDCSSVCKELVARVGEMIQVRLVSSVSNSEFTIKLDQLSVNESPVDPCASKFSLSGIQPDK